MYTSKQTNPVSSVFLSFISSKLMKLCHFAASPQTAIHRCPVGTYVVDLGVSYVYVENKQNVRLFACYKTTPKATDVWTRMSAKH